MRIHGSKLQRTPPPNARLLGYWARRNGARQPTNVCPNCNMPFERRPPEAPGRHRAEPRTEQATTPFVCWPTPGGGLSLSWPTLNQSCTLSPTEREVVAKVVAQKGLSRA